MTDAELKQQPKTVREEFEKIADTEVDGDSVIVNLRSELRVTQANRKAVSEKHDRIRSILANIQNDIDRTNLEIAEINGLRPIRIAAALIEGSDLSGDDTLLARRADLERFAERMTIACPAIEHRQRLLAQEVGRAAEPGFLLEEKIEQRRDELKLREARRRHGYA